jgi:hypothetical protein
MATGDRDDESRDFDPEAGERDRADDDASGCGGGGDGQDAAAAGGERGRQAPRTERSVAMEKAECDREDGGPEHRSERRETARHQHDDRRQRHEVLPAAPRQRAQRQLAGRNWPQCEPPRIGLDHQEDRKVVEQRRNDRHRDDLQVRDAQELGDQKCGRAHHRRREDRADAGRGENRPASIGRVAGTLHHRPRDRAQHHGIRDAASRHRAKQVSGDRHGSPGSRRSARSSDGGHRPVDEEAAGAAVLEDRTEDREQDDVRGGDVQRHAEHALERHVDGADDARRRVAAVGDQRQPDRIEERAVVRVDEKDHRDEWQHPSGGAPRCFEDGEDRHDPHREIDRGWRRRAVDEGLDVRERPE